MSQYPNIAAGQDLTADLLASMLPQFIYKTGTTTRTSTTTLADDPELQLAMVANASYFVEMFIMYSTTNAANFKDFWNLPAGASGVRTSIGIGSTQVADDNVSGQWVCKNAGTAITHGCNNSSSVFNIVQTTGVINTTSAGTLTYQWAQATSTAINTSVRPGSFVRWTRLA